MKMPIGCIIWDSSDPVTNTPLQLPFSIIYIVLSLEGLVCSSLVKTDDDLILYFSAYDNQRAYLGPMSGDSIDNLTPVSIQGNKVKSTNS